MQIPSQWRPDPNLSRKDWYIKLMQYFSNMFNSICVDRLSAFLAAWLQYFYHRSDVDFGIMQISSHCTEDMILTSPEKIDTDIFNDWSYQNQTLRISMSVCWFLTNIHHTASLLEALLFLVPTNATKCGVNKLWSCNGPSASVTNSRIHRYLRCPVQCDCSIFLYITKC